MDQHKSMMKAHRDLVRLIASLFDPEANIFQQKP
jgi:hypothetical protein